MGFSALATEVLIGAAVGGAVAVVTGGNPLKGALFGAVGGGIASAVGGTGAGVDAISGAGSVSGPAASAVEGVGVDAAQSVTRNLAEGIIDSAPAVAADGATGAFDVGGSTGFGGSTPISAAGDAAGTVLEGGVGPSLSGAGAPSPSSGLISRAMKWATDNPKIAAGVLQGAGSAIGGGAQAYGQMQSVKMKGEMDLENKEKLINFYRDFIQGGTQGGLGVKIPGTPGSSTPALTRPGGAPVYGPGGQLIVT